MRPGGTRSACLACVISAWVFPELGYVSLYELQTVKGKMGLPMERDLHFTAKKALSEYADEARNAGPHSSVGGNAMMQWLTRSDVQGETRKPAIRT